MTENDVAQDALTIERRFDAPMDLVWRMWTEPEHFTAWYGPDGATIPVAKMDVRVGGTRLVCMEMPTPDGPRRMWLAGEFREVVENERLVYTEFMSDENGNELAQAGTGRPDEHFEATEVRVVLEDVDGRTNMVLTHRGVAAGSPGAAGWAMAIDKLVARVEAQRDR
jgi:uncharacterized protein YndB with AHSA1/START domain